MSPTPLRVQLYSHDSQGLGHTRRNLALAHSLATHLPRLVGRPVTGMLLTGLPVPPRLVPENFDTMTLPGITKDAGAYAPRNLEVGIDELVAFRSAVLRTSITSFSPDLLIIDRHPYGVDGELLPALTELRRNHSTRIVLGLRDVLDAPGTVRREWGRFCSPRRLPEFFDQVWVYGDPHVHDLRTSGELPPNLVDLVRTTGYLSDGRPSEQGDIVPDEPYVLTMVGGGSDGMSLCAKAAAAPVPDGYRHLVVTGQQMTEADHRRVWSLAAPDVEVIRTVPDGLATIRGASALVAMAGYNTVTEVMSTRVPALLVPRERPRFEQLIRARALARHHAVDICRDTNLTSTGIGSWLKQAVGHGTDRSHLDLAGLERVPDLGAQLVGEVRLAG